MRRIVTPAQMDPEMWKSLHNELGRRYGTPGPRGELAKGESPVVRRYLATTEAMRQHIRNAKSERDATAVTYIWNDLREAAIFEIPTELFINMYHLADLYTTDLAGVPWRKAGDFTPSGETDKYAKMIEDSRGFSVPFPEHLPFPTCFLGYDLGVTLQDHQKGMYGIDPEADSLLYGTVVSHTGTVLTVVRSYVERTQERMVSFFPERNPEEGWMRPITLMPWIVTSILRWIEDHKTVTEEQTRSFSYRSHFKKQAKKYGAQQYLPRPYYTIYMKDQLIVETSQETFRSTFRKVIEWSHRWQVRGHDCIRVLRGSLPLDPKLEKKLKKRKYQIFTLGKPPIEVYEALLARGIQAKRVDEWLAVLVYRRDDFIKGPEGKPLIPGVRKSARKRLLEPNVETIRR